MVEMVMVVMAGMIVMAAAVIAEMAAATVIDGRGGAGL
jgi:hypothetical protein